MQNKYLTIINTYCQLQSLYSNLLESMLMPRKGTVTRCKFVSCNKVAPYYYWPTFYRSFARCRSPLRPTTCPFDIRGVVFPAPYAFLPKVTGRPWQHGHPDTRLTRLHSRSPTDRPRDQTRKTPSFLQFTPYCCQKTMPLWSSIFQVPFFTRINIGTLAFLQLHTTFWICFILLLDQVEI